VRVIGSESGCRRPILEERDEEMIENVARTLREEPMRVASSSFDARIMAAIRWGHRPGRTGAFFRWLVGPRQVAISPLGGFAAAVAMAAAVFLGSRSVALRGAEAVAGGAMSAVTDADAGQLVQFVLVAPRARSVAVVGDFNGWNSTATPLSSTSGNLWTVQLPLSPGRYSYVFVVDGTHLVPDPAAPPAPLDEFGQPSSVITVGSEAP
jgi:hypothetical protein